MININAKALELYPVVNVFVTLTNSYVDYNQDKRQRFIAGAEWLLSELSSPVDDEEVLKPYCFDIDGGGSGMKDEAIKKSDALKAMAEARVRERAKGDAIEDEYVERIHFLMEQLAEMKQWKADALRIAVEYTELEQQLVEKDNTIKSMGDRYDKFVIKSNSEIDRLLKEKEDEREKAYDLENQLADAQQLNRDYRKDFMGLKQQLAEKNKEVGQWKSSLYDCQQEKAELNKISGSQSDKNKSLWQANQRLKDEVERVTRMKPILKVDIDDLYWQWCKETKRNGGVVIGKSIKEWSEYLQNKIIP